jgi:tetratricopeptide (TPR) repeat protein
LINNLSSGKGAKAQGESLVMLAEILNHTDVKSNQEKAAQYYKQAVRIFTQSLQANNGATPLLLWNGIAHAGLYEYDKALDYLHTAEFVENRPFYLGMIYLWLGKVYQADGNNDEAKIYFTKVLSNLSADYHNSEAQELLK